MILRKKKAFYPHAKQRKMAELLLDPEDRRTKKEKCAEVGITHKTLCQWMKKPEYLEYINKQIDQYTNAELSEVWRALVNQCKRGNIQAMKLFFEMKELHPDVKAKLW